MLASTFRRTSWQLQLPVEGCVTRFSAWAPLRTPLPASTGTETSRQSSCDNGCRCWCRSPSNTAGNRAHHLVWPYPATAPARPQTACKPASDQTETPVQDCAPTYPRSCAHEGRLLVSIVECSSECPLPIEAKSSRSTAHTRLLNPRNKYRSRATSATSAHMAKRFIAGAVSLLHNVS